MNKKLLCTAVGAGLAAASGLAQAYWDYDYDIGVVPYVVKDANRTTVVTVMMGAQDDKNPNGADIVHLQYWTKSTTDANTAACSPSSVTVPVTPNDIFTFDTAGLLGYPLFGDATNPAPLGMSYWNETGNQSIEGSFWLELDLANGGATGDQTYLQYGDNFSQRDGQEIGTNVSHQWALRSDSADFGTTPVNFFPSSIASTVFTVTPMGSAMTTRENNQVILQVINDDGVQGAYDRNENGVDGTVPVTVRCVGRVTPAQLMPGVVANAAWAAQGGWGYLTNKGDGDYGTDSQSGTNSGDLSAIVYQVDSSSAGGKFLSNATRITSGQGYDYWYND